MSNVFRIAFSFLSYYINQFKSIFLEAFFEIFWDTNIGTNKLAVEAASISCVKLNFGTPNFILTKYFLQWQMKT